jgi:hypothetical protein
MFRCIVSASARDVILRLSPTNLGSRLHPTRDGRQAPVSLFSTSCLVVFLSGSTLPTTVPTYCVPTLSTLHLAAHIHRHRQPCRGCRLRSPGMGDERLGRCCCGRVPVPVWCGTQHVVITFGLA